MPIIDARIPLSTTVPQIDTPQEAELKGLQVQSVRQGVQARGQELKDQAQLRSILQQTGGDLEKAIPLIGQFNPRLRMELEKEFQGIRADAQSFQAKRLDLERDQADYLSQADDENDFGKRLITLKTAGFDVSTHAQQPWSPELKQSLSEAAMKPETRAARNIQAANEKSQEAARLAAAAPKPPALGSEADYLTRYARDRGTTPENLTTDDLVKARQEYGKEYAPKAAPALGSFEDYLVRYAAERKRPVSTLAPKDIEDARKRFNQADDQPRVNVSVSPQGQDDVKLAVQAMKAGTVPPMLPGRASKEYVAMLAEAQRQNYDLAKAATDWSATQKHIQTMNGAQQLRLNQAINALPDLLDSVDGLALKWKGGRFPILNKVNLAAAKNGVYGREEASLANQLSTQIADVVGDLGTVYMGGNSPTDHGLKLAETALNGDWDEKVLHDMVKLAKSNVQIRRNSINTTGVAGASDDNPYVRKPAPSESKADPLGIR